MSEFNLIDRYFKALTTSREDVLVDIGDDCAITQIPEGYVLATSTDTLIAGVHFPHQTRAEDIGYKALAVNLSDLAAMGAQPAWASLALTLPANDDAWLNDFCRGFQSLAQKYGVQLIGGDTTRGALSITVQIQGFVKPGKYLTRRHAQIGDLIYVSGTLGDAGLGLQSLLNKLNTKESLNLCKEKLNRPIPRIELGQSLIDVSHCAIDISDGLSSDLQHILDASQCAAVIELDALPLSKELKSFYGDHINWQQVISSGDDYELCFTIPPSRQTRLDAMADQLNLNLSKIGTVVKGEGITFINTDGSEVNINTAGYNHFL